MILHNNKNDTEKWNRSKTLDEIPKKKNQRVAGRWPLRLFIQKHISSVQFSSVAQSCQTLCDPMDCSTLGFPVHHQLPEFTQTHVYRVGDAIQPSHPLLTPSLPSIFPRIRVFSNVSVLCNRWPKYWSFSFSISPSNESSGLVSFRITGWISLRSKGLSRVFSNTTIQKHQFFSSQLFL